MELAPADTPEQLAEYEAVIRDGLASLASYLRVGEALTAIKKGKAYRTAIPGVERATFEEYCKERFGFGDERAGQIQRAATTTQVLVSDPAERWAAGETVKNYGILPNEATARELSALRENPEVMREVWQRVVDEAEATGHKPSATRVRLAIAAVDPARCDTNQAAALDFYLRELIQLVQSAAAELGRITPDDVYSCNNVELYDYRKAVRDAKSAINKLLTGLLGDAPQRQRRNYQKTG